LLVLQGYFLKVPLPPCNRVAGKKVQDAESRLWLYCRLPHG
jgi:hypothetical protein